MKKTGLSPLLFFKSHPMRFSMFAFFVALFQTSALNLAFYAQVFHTMNFNSLRDVIFFGTMPVVIFCVVFAFLNALLFPFLAKIAAVLFFLIGAPLTYFMVTFNVVINHDMLINVLATDECEARSLITPMLGIYIMVFGLLPALLVALVRIKPSRPIGRYLSYRLLCILTPVVVIIFIAFFFYKNYAAFFRNNTVMTRYLLPSNYIGAVLKHYDYLKNRNLPFKTIGEDAYIGPKNPAQTKKTLMVLIIGETARAQNFTLNDYPKLTTPRLSKLKNLINFKHTSSCGTFTAHSVPCMLSNMRRENYNATQASHQTNVLDILKLAGINLLWHDNDSGCQGTCSRIESVDMTGRFRESSPLCQDGTCFDEILLTGLDDYIERLDNQDALITLHTIGSHGPTYYRRYPKKFSVFTPSCDTNEINRCDKNALINTYDNTILYTDYVIAKTVELLKKYSQQYNVIMLYMSDHGESLGENGLYLHSMPYAFAPKEQTHIPFLIWASTPFFKQKQIDVNCMMHKANQESFSHDNLFHTLLGIFDVKTNEYQSNLDIFSHCKLAYAPSNQQT